MAMHQLTPILPHKQFIDGIEGSGPLIPLACTLNHSDREVQYHLFSLDIDCPTRIE